MPRHQVTARPALLPRRVWRGWTALVLAGVSSITGCYTQRPVTGAPPPGTTVVLDLSDRGRVALGDSIGTAASRIEGVVQSSSDSSYVLRVSSVQYLNGQSNRWSGEPLSVRTDLIGRTRERQFSRSRTWALGLGVAAAILTVALTTDLFGRGTLGRSNDGSGPGNEQ
jgi:hypothetical protein